MVCGRGGTSCSAPVFFAETVGRKAGEQRVAALSGSAGCAIFAQHNLDRLYDTEYG